ncbi:MAG: radical SAM protein [Planctomycetes bacterium]|nr:radical SAM protein [Planctomycetota bacterium]
MNSHLPPAVNFHLWKTCNLNCLFCYATFNDTPELRKVRGGIKEADAFRIIELLRDEGVEKLTFVGGEPTLCPYLSALLRRSRELGFVNTLVTNGFRLQRILEEVSDYLNWVGLSVDSANEVTQAALGRGRGNHIAQSLEHFQSLHDLGIRVKLNTVVTSLNWQEDMSDFVRRVRPERWKIFQVLPIEGQNSGKVESLLITSKQFQTFVNRHRSLIDNGIKVVAETNEDMTESYAMIDPLGRFFSNVGGRHKYSPRSILEVGVVEAFKQIAFDQAKFEARGGDYDWGTPQIQVPLTISVRR